MRYRRLGDAFGNAPKSQPWSGIQAVCLCACPQAQKPEPPLVHLCLYLRPITGELGAVRGSACSCSGAIPPELNMGSSVQKGQKGARDVATQPPERDSAPALLQTGQAPSSPEEHRRTASLRGAPSERDILGFQPPESPEEIISHQEAPSEYSHQETLSQRPPASPLGLEELRRFLRGVPTRPVLPREKLSLRSHHGRPHTSQIGPGLFRPCVVHVGTGHSRGTDNDTHSGIQ